MELRDVRPPNQPKDPKDFPVFASTSLIRDRDGNVLSVSRKTDHEDLGLPGGKLEPNETAYDAMVRETLEETGLKVLDAKLIFEAIDDVGVRAVVYDVTLYTGELQTKEKGVVSWVRPKDMITDKCSFRLFNIALFDCLGMQ
jgi:8-oxo-dGTP pyrophosphatase MutT (NUDIX family)